MFNAVNLCVVCAECNVIKRDQEVEKCCENVLKRKPRIYPKSSAAFKVVHPHFDDWHEHIEIISGIFLHITKKGLFTIFCCELNRMYRKYGYSDKEVSDSTYMGLMDKYKDTNDPTVKARILDQIVQLRFFGRFR